jgi:N-acetylglucosamine malate deacetylase 1
LPGHERGGLLLVGAHVADMEFTAGHLAAAHARAGQPVTFLHLTAGEAGHPAKGRAAYREQKLAEAEAAASRLGGQCRVLGYPDGGLTASPEVVAAVAAAIDEYRPDVLVTHWRGSWHPDHANCNFAVERALAQCRAAGTATAPEVFYAENWEDADGFQPDVLVDITNVADDWLAAARCHELFRGGVVAFDYQGYYDALTRSRGCLAGVRRAAAFMRARCPVPQPQPGLWPTARPPAARAGEDTSCGSLSGGHLSTWSPRGRRSR